MTRTLSVWWDGVVVGSLQVNEHGQMRFTYAADWLADASRPAISFSLPKQEPPFTQRECRPFFAGLLPEEAQRRIIAGALGFSKGNDFAFLEALGPTFKTGFDLLRRATTRPAGAVLAFLDVAIFNLIVGNADAHGKNFSLLYHGAVVSLAPFYDLLLTVAYPDLSPNLAMKIAKRATLEEIGPTTWTEFAEDIGLPTSFVRRRVRELSDAVSSHVTPLPDSAALAGLDAPALKKYAALIASRAERLARTLTT